MKSLVIAELKQESLDRNSPFYKLMKKERIRPYRLSKYCIGSVEIYGEEVLKFNRFKKKLLFLNKINHDNSNFYTRKRPRNFQFD